MSTLFKWLLWLNVICIAVDLGFLAAGSWLHLAALGGNVFAVALILRQHLRA